MKTLFVLILLFISSYQPVVMIIGLFFLTLIYSMMMYIQFSNFWFSYMLLLVMLSGVMVVMIYMISLIPNERFEFMMMIYSGLMLFIFINSLVNFNMGSDLMEIQEMWNSKMLMINLFLIILLLLLMVMVVWLTFWNKFPLRIMWKIAWLKD